MRVWLLVLLLALMAGVWLRYLMGRGERPPWIVTGAVVALMIPMAWFEWQWQQTVAEASRIVRAVSGRGDATAECQRMAANFFYAGAHEGFVAWEEGDERGTGATAFLTYKTCSELRQWLGGDKQRPSIDQINAVHTLTHEAMHVAGFRNEAETECQAMAWDQTVAEALGADERHAEGLARTYRRIVYPQLRSNYRTDCTDVEVWNPQR